MVYHLGRPPEGTITRASNGGMGFGSGRLKVAQGWRLQSICRPWSGARAVYPVPSPSLTEYS